MDKKGKNQGRYGNTSGIHSSGKGDEGGRYDRRDDISGNRRTRNDQATFQQQQQRDWESSRGGWQQRNNFQHDKKPPLAAGNPPITIPLNLPSNIDTLPPRFKRKYLLENGLPPDFFETLQASNPAPPPQQLQHPQSYNNNNNNNHSRQQGNKGGPAGNRGGGGGGGGGDRYFQKPSGGGAGLATQPPQRSRSPSDQVGGGSDSRHSSRNSSLDRKYERRRSPENFRRGNEWKTNSNFFNRNKRRGDGDERRFDDRNGQKKDVLDWSHEVEQEDRKRERRNYNDGSFENGNRRRNRSNSRSNQERRNFYNPNEHFKVPYPAKAPRSRSRKNSQSSLSRENSADRSFTRSYRSHSGNRFSSSRENSTERYHQTRDPTNWRAPITTQTQTDTKIAEMTKQFVETVDLKEKPGSGGILTLPNASAAVLATGKPSRHSESSDFSLHNGCGSGGEHRTLFDPKNPDKPIVVVPKQIRTTGLGASAENRSNRTSLCEPVAAHPSWYDTSSEAYKRAHNPKLIERMYQLDVELQGIVDSRELFRKWQRYNDVRRTGQSVLVEFLRCDLKFCAMENVEQHCWKVLFYNVIELLRKPLAEATVDAETKAFYREKLTEVIEPGAKYWEELLGVLEDKYKFKVDEYTGTNANNRIYQSAVTEDAGRHQFVKLALVSVQKIFLCLGDLARYKELINETNNYGKAKQYYTKAQQLLPKNGRPYNQLALLSVYSKRKIDAVYFYMRSLMSSNPFQSARESLIALFDEIRKKYKHSQKRREERNRLRLKEKEHRFDGGQLRRETWIHPEGGRKLHRTAPLDAIYGATSHSANDSTDEEKLNQLDTLEVNKRFITSFLHIQGKLITKIGMESFQQCAIQMLREFRALIQHSPIAITCQRLLQLIALNMFAIDCSQLKDPQLIASGGRSEVQECAVIVGMLMFGIILERFLYVVKESSSLVGQQQQKVTTTTTTASTTTTSAVQSPTEVSERKSLHLPEDAKEMLPAIKVWCDWMSKQQNVWNPPPFFGDYKISSNSNYDPWLGLTNLMNLLESSDLESSITSMPSDDTELVKLLENVVLAGFTPIDHENEPIYAKRGADMESAENDVRLLRVLKFGREILCTCNPPVLIRRTHDNGTIEYSNAVQNRPEESSDSEILLECFSDDEEVEDVDDISDSSTLLLNAIKRGQVNTNKLAVDEDDEHEENSNSTRSSNKSNNLTTSTTTTTTVAATAAVATSASDSNECQAATVAADDSDELIKSGNSYNSNSNESAAEIRRLKRRKDELERQNKMQEKYNQRLKDILSQSTIALNMEVRPKFLVPDTNCFVDYLHHLQAIANAYPLYQLMVPLVVINELEGLSKGLKPPTQPSSLSDNTFTALGVVPISAQLVSQAAARHSSGHAQMVADASKEALVYLKTKPAAVKLVTTKGHQIKTFIASEDDSCEQKANDDKILDTALNLCKSHKEEIKGDIRRIVREVVLITKDRNLRVKALSNDLPVRELPDFIKWAGLGS